MMYERVPFFRRLFRGPTGGLHRLATCLVGLVLLVAPAAAGAAGTSPKAVVESMQAALLDVWRNGRTLTPKARSERLAGPLSEAFDFARMIEVATGPSWSQADPAIREDLARAFARFSVSTYADRFDDYNGQSFEIEGERTGSRNRAMVDTRILARSGPVPITYVLEQREDGWRIVDVLLESGISELSIRRSEYRAILKTGGPEALVRKLDELSETLLQP